MSFVLPKYRKPQFRQAKLAEAPQASCAPAPMDGVAPDCYHATSIFPEYFHVGDAWLLAEQSRMDCVAVLQEEQGQKQIIVKEFRHIQKGDMVFLGRTENGEDGILVHANGFQKKVALEEDLFSFRSGRSRETPYTKDYDHLYELLRHEKEHGFTAWVLGPACVFDARSRKAMCELIRAGFVDVILAGNALATHDLEGAYLRTALGQDIYTQRKKTNGHYHHMEVINKVRQSGSIAQFIDDYDITDGILYECVKKGVPFVLAGSIRDDGPLPEVYGDVYEAQDAMRHYIGQATTVIGLATQLHTIATGNMTPSFRVIDGKLRPVYFYCIDISEFAVNKLRDRGSLAVTTVVTNVQDFLVNLQYELAMNQWNKSFYEIG